MQVHWRWHCLFGGSPTRRCGWLDRCSKNGFVAEQPQIPRRPCTTTCQPEIPRLHDHNFCMKTALVGVYLRIKISCPASLGLIIVVLSEYDALDLQLRSLPQCDTLRPQSCQEAIPVFLYHQLSPVGQSFSLILSCYDFS
jgi:hypothetical protein